MRDHTVASAAGECSFNGVHGRAGMYVGGAKSRGEGPQKERPRREKPRTKAVERRAGKSDREREREEPRKRKQPKGRVEAD